jgi:hypothetical protein
MPRNLERHSSSGEAPAERAPARAIRGYLDDPVGGRRLGAQGRRHVEETFALTALVRALDRLYRRLVER